MNFLSACASLPLDTVLSLCAGIKNNVTYSAKPNCTFVFVTNRIFHVKCLAQLAGLPGDNVPAFTAGKLLDNTGQRDTECDSTLMSRGVTEMVTSALWRTGKVRRITRVDLRIPLARRELVTQRLMLSTYQQGLAVTPPASSPQRPGLANFAAACATPVNKQLSGSEVEANAFHFVRDKFVEFNDGCVENEPLLLGVRSVLEIYSNQIMTDSMAFRPDRLRTGGDRVLQRK